MIRIPKNFLRNSLKLLGPRGIKWLIVGLIASIGIALVELSVSVVIQLLLISFGFLSTSTRIGYLQFIHLPMPVYTVTIILCITAALRFTVQLTSTQTAAFIRDYVSHRLKQNTVAQMLFSNSLEFRISSAVNFKISEVFVKAAEFIFNLSLFLSMLVQSIFLFLIMFLIAWKESFIALLGIFIIGLSVIFINKAVSKFAKQVPKEQKKLNEGIEKIARNFIFIKLMKKREEEYQTINDSLCEYSSKSTRANFFSNFGSQAAPFLGILLLVCVILVSQSAFQTLPLTLISFVYLLARFVQSLSILSGYFGNTSIFLPQYSIALDSISNSNFESNCKTVENEISIIGLRSHKPITKLLEKIKSPNIDIKIPNISFQNMNFQYENSLPLFQNLNLKIRAGTQIGIMGASGTGKSTLLMLMTGILQPTSGYILIDNMPAQDYVSQEQTRVGYVGAEPFLIQGTLRENLCYGLTLSVTDEEIHLVLKMVSLESLIQEKNLNYVIGEDQSGLSAGQKQRVCLARAILNKPGLLILDEATANLDENNENQVALILNQLKGRCTTIIVSHRPGILAFVDELIEMNTLLTTTNSYK
ncbi:MAG: ABC transporter ATP-binding protein [Bdellovibrionota bacterium]